MYEERKNDFSLRGIIIQILFVVLFVFILLWLFPTKNYVKDYVDDTFTNKLQPLYSQIYSQNITTMKEAAISYFTTDRLPSKVGDNVTMTLKEMQDKKLVLDLIDSNNNKCDINESYVKIVKEKTEYLLTVKLSCSDTTDYIEVHLGCYDYCEASGVCEKEETTTKPIITKKYQYEYEKITDGKWGNWSNWSEWTTTEATKTEYRNVETKVEKVQTGTKTVTVGTSVETVDATPVYGTTYSCPSGYTLSGTKCTKTVKTTSSIDATKKTTYSCPSGYTLNGTKCTKTTSSTSSIDATATTTYSEWTYIGKYTFNSIQYTTDTRKVVRVSSSINTDCTTNCTENTYTYLVYTRKANTTYSCPSGYTQNGTKCTKTTSSTSSIDATAKTTYLCPTTSGGNAYTLSGTKCTTTSTKTVSVAATKNTYIKSYNCDVGTLSGNKCVITTPKTEQVAVYSEITYYRIQTREFISGSRDVKWSTSKNDKTLLEQGYVLTGNKKEIK